jgi:hypothetical protein
MAGRDPDEYITPVYIIYAVWPLAVMSIIFAYLMFFGLPDYYRQVCSTPSQTTLLSGLTPYVSGAAFRSQLLQDLVPKKVGHLVPGR